MEPFHHVSSMEELGNQEANHLRLTWGQELPKPGFAQPIWSMSGCKSGFFGTRYSHMGLGQNLLGSFWGRLPPFERLSGFIGGLRGFDLSNNVLRLVDAGTFIDEVIPLVRHLKAKETTSWRSPRRPMSCGLCSHGYHGLGFAMGLEAQSSATWSIPLARPVQCHHRF